MRLKLLLFTLLLTFSLSAMATHPWLEDEKPGPDLGIELVVYPNPSNGVFFLNIKNENLNADALKVKIVNLLGQTVASQEVDSNKETKFDLSTLPKGMYFVRVQVDKDEMIKRVVIR